MYIPAVDKNSIKQGIINQSSVYSDHEKFTLELLVTDSDT